MNIRCPKKSDCFDPATPLSNYSSEAPDAEIFIATPPGPPIPPPIGTHFTADGCEGIVCESTVSLEDALLCAARSYIECLTRKYPTPPTGPYGGGGGGTPEYPDDWPPAQPSTIFVNHAQTCEVFCGDGQPYQYTVPAGLFYSLFGQLHANYMALSYACQFANSNKLCLTAVPTSMCVGEAVNVSILATGPNSTASNVWEIISGALPDGLTFTPNGQTALIEGTPTTVGDYDFTVQVTLPNGDVQTRAYTVKVRAIVTSSPLPTAYVDEPYSVTFAVAGFAGDVLYQLSGVLPVGLTFDAETGTISGTAEEPGESTVLELIAADAVTAEICVKDFVLETAAPEITTSSPLPSAVGGNNYYTTLAQVGLTAPVQWSVISGALPTGLTLNAATGEISGIPSDTGTFNFVVQAADAYTDTNKSFSMEVSSGGYLWFKMEEPGTDTRIDSINGEELPAFEVGGSAIVSRTAGIIDFAADLQVPAIEDQTAALFKNGFLSMPIPAGGFLTTVGWFYYSIPSGTNTWIQILSTSWAFLFSNSFPGGGLVQRFIGDFNFVAPTQDAWHFFVLELENADPGFGSLEFDRNGVPILENSGGGAVSTFARLMVQAQTGSDTVGPAQILIDEVGLFPRQLSNAEKDYLYNAGAGRTSPIVFPP